MSEPIVGGPTRRGFLKRTFVLAGSVSIASGPVFASAGVEGRTADEPVPGYHALDTDEASFVETMVNTLCPADHLTADGVSSGLASFIDRRLAVDGRAVGSAAAGQAQLFRAGVAATNQACRERYGTSFDRLGPPDARDFLRDVRAGRVAAAFPLSAWSTQIVDPLLTDACFSGPVYGAYGSRMFFKLFGYVTAPVRSSI